MNSIPTIGGARGIFEIFVPGVFLLLNLAAFLYILNPSLSIYPDIKDSYVIVLSFFIIVCFGYLFGVILRLFRVDKVDGYSAWFNRRFFKRAQEEDKFIFSWDNVLEDDAKKLRNFLKDDLDINWAEKARICKTNVRIICISAGKNSAELKMAKMMKKLTLKTSKENIDVSRSFLKFSKKNHIKVKKENGTRNIYVKTYKLWASEKFPYIGRIGEVCKFLPPETLKFYSKIWAGRGRKGHHNQQFFNFCKTMLISVDERAASEIYSAEALNRYIAGTFYSLVIAFCLLFCAVILNHSYAGMPFLLLFMSIYLFAIEAILSNLRLIRIKEVELVFAATFKNRLIFEEKISNSRQHDVKD